MNNRRKSPRLEKRLPLQVEGQPSWLLDLSASGARIQVTDQLYIGGCVEMQVNDRLCLRGRAVWQRGQQAGVAFHDLDPEDQEQLARLLVPDPNGWPKWLALALVVGGLLANFLVSQATYYYTLYQVNYGG